RSVEQFVGPRLQEVAEQDCRRDAEVLGLAAKPLLSMHRCKAHVCCRSTTASVRTVDDIVVDQRGSVKKFESAGDIEHRLEYVVDGAVHIERAHSSVAVHSEKRAKTLASGQEAECFFEQGNCIGAE